MTVAEQLIKEADDFSKNAIEICNSCEFITEKIGIRTCGKCGCFLVAKIVSSKLIKSSCPLGKW